MTHRQFMVWTSWLSMQWNEPDRSDYYMMTVAMEVFYSNRKRPRCPDPKNWKIPFKQRVTTPEQERERERGEGLTVAEAALIAKRRWSGVLGRDLTKLLPPPNVEQGLSDEDED